MEWTEIYGVSDATCYNSCSRVILFSKVAGVSTSVDTVTLDLGVLILDFLIFILLFLFIYCFTLLFFLAFFDKFGDGILQSWMGF